MGDKVRAEAERDEMWKLLECQHGMHLECSMCLGTTRAEALKGWRETRSALSALEARHERLVEASQRVEAVWRARGESMQVTHVRASLYALQVALEASALASPEPEPAEGVPSVPLMSDALCLARNCGHRAVFDRGVALFCSDHLRSRTAQHDAAADIPGGQAKRDSAHAPSAEQTRDVVGEIVAELRKWSRAPTAMSARDVLHKAAQHVEKRWGTPSKPGKETP